MGAAKRDPKAPVMHRVLYVNSQPVLSREVSDKEPAESHDHHFSAAKVRALNSAHAAGAAEPEFRETIRTAIALNSQDHDESEEDYVPGAKKSKEAK